MGEYISRSKSEFELCEGNIPEPYKSFCRRVINDRNLIPAADVAPVRHGQWDGEGDGYADGELVIDVWYCSCCGHCIDDGTDDPTILPNYCPNCGARMDGARNGEEKD